MLPLEMSDDPCPETRHRTTRRVSRAGAVLAGAAVILTGTALPALAISAPTPTLPASCADIRNADNTAADGEYHILLAGADTLVTCADMAGSPRAYLSLPHVGGQLNFSSGPYWGGDSYANRTNWTKVRVVNRGEVVDGTTCASDACVDTVDPRFSTTVVGDFMRYTMANGPWYYHGYASADFSGTPFAMDPTGIAQGGYDVQGSITFSHDNQTVYLDGKGNSGSTSSVTNLLPLVRLYSPAAPTDLSASRGNGSTTLTFTPGSNGGSTVSSYEVSTDAGTTWNPLTTNPGSGGTVSGTVTGLTNGTSYTFLVHAINDIGASPASTSTSMTPATTPDAPTALTATRGNGTATLAFTPGDNGGDAVSGYEVSTNGGDTWNPLDTTPGTDDTLTGTVSGLTNGTSYSFLVHALNGAGAGAASTTANATPATTPDAPTNLTVTPLMNSVRLSFEPASDGGDAITGYEVSTGNGFTTLATTPGTGDALVGTVAGLGAGGQYRFSVRAVNGVGGGATAQATGNTLPPIAIPPVINPAPPVVNPAPPVKPTIDGPAATLVTPQSTVVVSGTAPAGSTVKIYFRERNQTTFVKRRVLTAGQDGRFRTTYVANDDYRYYAEVDGRTSPTVLTQLRTTVAEPAEQVVRRGSTVTLHGTANPGSVIDIHFHKLGTPRDDYSIVRPVVVKADGTWVRPYVASTDYRFYVVSHANWLSSGNYLIQAR